MNDLPELYSLERVAEYLHVPAKTVKEWARIGAIACLRIRRRPYFFPEDIRNFVMFYAQTTRKHPVSHGPDPLEISENLALPPREIAAIRKKERPFPGQYRIKRKKPIRSLKAKKEKNSTLVVNLEGLK